MKPVVAILVGHYGPGTGCSFGSNDEWTLARRDATALKSRLDADAKIDAFLEPLEDTDALRGHDPIGKAAVWAKETGAHAVIELHYNSTPEQDTDTTGNEVVVAKGSLFAGTMDKALSTLPNRHRDVKFRPGLELFGWLKSPAVAILEVAFIWEPQVSGDEWPGQVASAVAGGLYEYFNGWGERDA